MADFEDEEVGGGDFYGDENENATGFEDEGGAPMEEDEGEPPPRFEDEDQFDATSAPAPRNSSRTITHDARPNPPRRRTDITAPPCRHLVLVLTAGPTAEKLNDLGDPERRFCPQCGNLWQPREDRTNRTLMLTCRTCGRVQYEEPASTGKVYENRIKKEVSMRLDSINPEVIQDPTLQRSNQVSCDSCGHNEAVLFQAESGIKAVSLSLIFVCCNCANKWVG